MSPIIHLVTNLSANMVVVKAMLISTNTAAFEHYALRTALSNTQVVARCLNVNLHTPSTNNIEYSFRPGVLGVCGWVTFGGRYSFQYWQGSLRNFDDKEYSSIATYVPDRPQELQVGGENGAVVTRWLHLTNYFAGSTGVARALAVATTVNAKLFPAGCTFSRHGPPTDNQGRGFSASYQEMFSVGGVPTPMPLYEFEWFIDYNGQSIGCEKMEVSGLTTNVAHVLFPSYYQLSKPRDYYRLLGLPEGIIFVEKTKESNVYRVIDPERLGPSD